MLGSYVEDRAAAGALVLLPLGLINHDNAVLTRPRLHTVHTVHTGVVMCGCDQLSRLQVFNTDDVRGSQRFVMDAP